MTGIDFVQLSAQRVASVPTIESGMRAKSGSIWESLSKRTSASSLINLATRTTCMLTDMRQFHPEKKNSERQTDKEMQEKEEKQNKEAQGKEEKQDKKIPEKEEKQDIEKEQKIKK